ncbi:MAG: Asp-tRNA(Asn)/Glu-tRNA(Gln) amidotransferase subunit GatB [bacterium]
MNNFKTIIGLEIHAQLNTESKMFCSCSNDAEGKAPNTLVCPICLGLPGTLPVANNQAIEHVCKIGLALSSKLAKLSWFDRKHYFYPDLPKGYQISQYQKPFCEGGELEIDGKKIRINRVHLEEDAGKLVHPNGGKSYVDLNRAGTPLAEIVTEPDIESSAQAKEFMKELRELLRSIGVSDADMEKGHLRCDANISIVKSEKGKGKSSPIVEIKNLNSFKFVEKALEIEEKRLREDFDSWPEKQTKVTRGFDSKNNKTYQLREKEESKDYRYFPEPDIPPIELHELFDLEKIKSELGKLPSRSRSELEEIGLDEQTAKVVMRDKKILSQIYLLKEKGVSISHKLIKTLINEKTTREFSAEQLEDLAVLLEKGIPSNILRSLISEAQDQGKLPSEFYEEDSTDIEAIVEEVLRKNNEAVLRYKSGKTEVIGFLIGEAMKLSKGKANPGLIREKIIEKIKE